jgi:hypothetical protein
VHVTAFEVRQVDLLALGVFPQQPFLTLFFLESAFGVPHDKLPCITMAPMMMSGITTNIFLLH